jgi:hypothetical protein
MFNRIANQNLRLEDRVFGLVQVEKSINGNDALLIQKNIFSKQEIHEIVNDIKKIMSL